MSEIFLKIVNMSISASWVVLAVLLLRLLLKKAPKWINGILWGIVGLRLIMPFSFESIFSLIPSAETFSKASNSLRPHFESGVTVIDNQVNDYLGGHYCEGVTRPAGLFADITTVLAVVWIVGIIVLLLYTIISYLRVKNKIGTAVILRDNIYQSESVVSPFVLGIIKPKIFLPFNMSKQDEDLVIAHEEAHIKRKDHFWKPLGFIILTIHWFNPLMWLGYVLLCRDIEIACDEKVVKKLSNEQRTDYSQALLNCSVNRRMIAACPLAFGEVGVKERVKGVLNYKKPAFWILVVSIIAIVVASVCLLTNPHSAKLENIVGKYDDSAVRIYTSSDSETYHSVGEVSKDLLHDLLNLKISKYEISQNRSEERDKSYTLVLQTAKDAEPLTSSYLDGLYIYFDDDFTEVWVYDGIKPTLTYKVFEPQKAKKVYEYIKNYNVSESAVGGVSGPQSVVLTNALYKFKSDNDTATLSLSATDNTGSFSYSLLSSYMVYGTYEDDGNNIVLKTDDGKFRYIFKKENDTMKFIADKSSKLPSYAYSSGAKAEICVPDGAVFEKVEPEFVYTIDNIVFDIDKDGKDETCVLGYGPTSGLFTFTLTIIENGKAEYFNIYNSYFAHLSFDVQNGVLRLKAMTQGENPETKYFDFVIEENNIVIVNDGNKIAYWGEQGLNSPFAPKGE